MNIAITGEGIISAIGTNKEEVLQSLLAHKSGIKEMQFLQSVHHELPVGEVALSNEQMKKRLGIPEKQLMSRTELMGILAIRQALEDAGIDLSSVSASNKKIVLVSGTTVGGMDHRTEFQPSLRAISVTEGNESGRTGFSQPPRWRQLHTEDC